MKDEQKFKKVLKQKNVKDQIIGKTIFFIDELEKEVLKSDKTLESCPSDIVVLKIMKLQ